MGMSRKNTKMHLAELKDAEKTWFEEVLECRENLRSPPDAQSTEILRNSAPAWVICRKNLRSPPDAQPKVLPQNKALRWRDNLKPPPDAQPKVLPRNKALRC